MYSEDELLPLSAIQHFMFCERQCALIHIEQVWAENLFTAQGRVMHEKAHSESAERRKGVRAEFGMPIRSLKLGLSGKADVVEFSRLESGPWRPFPVEYKRGRTKPDNRDNVQLCAQALCLEEMAGAAVPRGAIYYGRERRRTEVVFDDLLRKETADAAFRLHRLVGAGITPPPVYEKKCDTCSLFSLCMPKSLGRPQSVKNYFKKMTAQS